jgi:hypothetical protein
MSIKGRQTLRRGQSALLTDAPAMRDELLDFRRRLSDQPRNLRRRARAHTMILCWLLLWRAGG